MKRAPLIAAIMKRLEENYALFMETGDLSQLMEKYSELLVNKDRDVMILGAKEQYVAHALGINKTGELIVRKKMERSKKSTPARSLCEACTDTCKM